MSIISHEKRVLFEQIISEACQDNSELSLLLQHIRDAKFMQAKFQLSIMNDLNLPNGTYDFFGDESKFTKCTVLMISLVMRVNSLSASKMLLNMKCLLPVQVITVNKRKNHK